MDSNTTIPSLRLMSEQILRYNWVRESTSAFPIPLPHLSNIIVTHSESPQLDVRDVGDCPYEVVSNVLKLSTASQLSEIEENSPHLAPNTNGERSYLRITICSNL